MMSEQEIEELSKTNAYHFFVFSSPTSIPIPLAIHTWIVIVENGNIERREVLYQKNQCKTSWDYLHLNAIKLSKGLTVFFWGKKNRFKAHLLYHIAGDEGSLAKEAVKKAKQKIATYPFKSIYRLPPGPNSNTFTQQILNAIPGISFKLPWNAFGKGYTWR